MATPTIVRATGSGRGASRWLLLLVVGILVLMSGCRLSREQVRWYAPQYPRPVANISQPNPCCGVDWLAKAESTYAYAHTLEESGASGCVGFYCNAAYAAGLAWQETPLVGSQGARTRRACELYHGAVGKMIETSLQFGLFDPHQGIRYQSDSGTRVIPIAFHGFAWKPDDFNGLRVVGDYKTKELSRIYRRDGVGVPLIVHRCRSYDETNYARQHPFAATAVLQLQHQPNGQSRATLAFYNPFVYGKVRVAQVCYPLKADLSAPFATLLTRKSDFLTNFISPGSTTGKVKLYMLEPYQKGKIPVVLVHGLLSESQTWVNVVNELQADPKINARFQFWAFRYPTGEQFLRSAAALRCELQNVIATCDPQRTDPEMGNMILVGHSMGGLISRLQVSESGNTIWQSIANRPLEQISVSPQQYARFQETCFFAPQPHVKRVIYIGTPHGGSSSASRMPGRIAARLVDGTAIQQEHERLVTCNPGVFNPKFTDRPPTSVDLLEPDSPILLGMRQLPSPRDVHFHSIIGNGRRSICSGPGDGVVPVSSARVLGVASERLVPAVHSRLHHHPDTLEEMKKILWQHASGMDCNSKPAGYCPKQPGVSPWRGR